MHARTLVRSREIEVVVTIVGDRKGPQEYPAENCKLLTIEQQKQMPWELARVLPENHYTRKNLGYLDAISEGAARIYETNDDNAPIEG